MEYNNYYPAQTAGHPPPPPPMQNHQQHGCSPVQIIPGTGMMHNPGPPPPPQGAMVRQVVTPGIPPGHPLQMQQQQQPPPQHMMPHHMQPMPPQQQQSHPNNSYHQLPPHPPSSHSASPRHLPSPHPNHQTNLNLQPPSRPSTGPSPLHPMHQQSPHHMGGGVPPPMHVPSQQQPPPPQQQLNQMTASGSPRLLPPPPGVNHQGPHAGLPLPPPHHAFMGPGGGVGPMSHPNPHYQQNPQGPPHPLPHALPPGPSPMHMSQQMPPSSAYHPHAQPHPGMVADRGSPFYQNIPQTEFRIIELNKRLQNRPRPRVPNSPLPLIETSGESYWWERFACDFFDDESTLTLRLPSEDKSAEYTIGRTLIPRFFRSYFEGGAVDLSIKLRNTRETSQRPNLITLDCDQADVTSKIFFKHPNSQFPINVVVNTEGQLSLDFVSNNFDNLLIKSWRFNTIQCREYIDRSVTSTGLPNAFLIEPVTRHGLTKQTIAYLKMCMIMEPMQELMLTHRQTKMDPRSCLKDLLYNKYKLKSVDDNRVQPNKRRKRKTPATTGAGGTKKTKANNNAQQAMNNNNLGFNNINNSLMTPTPISGAPGNVGMPNMSLASQDVMVVGEPSMLGADFGDENERRITRLENNQFDTPNNTNHNSTPNANNNNNGITQNSPLNQGQNQMCNSNQNLNQPNNMNHMQQHQQLQNNHDTGNMQMMNHTNSNSGSNNSLGGNSNGSSTNSNNNGTGDSNNGNNNINGNNCIQNNNISHQMSPIINMNGNMNHMGHLVKTEQDLKQSAPPTTDAEAR